MGFPQLRSRPQPSGPVTYTLILTGSISSSGALARQSQPIYPGSVSPTGALAKKISANYAGSETAAGAILKAMTGRVFSGTISSSASLSNLAVKVRAFAGTVTSSGVLAEKVLRGFAGIVSTSGTLAKKVFRSFAGTVTSSATLAAFKSFFTIAGTVTSSGLLIRKPGIVRAGTVTSSGSAGRVFSKLISGAFSAGATTIGWTAVSGATGYKFYIGTTTGVYTYDGSPIDVGNVLQYRITNLPNNPYFVVITAYNLNGESGPSSEYSETIAGGIYSDLTQRIVKVKAIGGVLTPVGAIAKKVSKFFSGAWTATGAAVAAKIAKLSFQGVTSSSGLIIRQPIKALFAAISSSGSLTKNALRIFSGTFTLSGTRIAKAARTFAGAVSSSGALTTTTILHLFTIILSGGVSSSGALAKLAKRFWGGTLSPSGIVQKIPSRAFAGVITSSGATANFLSKLVSGTVNSSGAIVKRSGRTLTGFLQPVGNIVLSSISGLKLILLIGSVTPIGNVFRLVSSFKGGSANIAGALSNRAQKGFAGLITLAGSVTTLRPFSIILDGMISIVGTVTTILSEKHLEFIRTYTVSLVKKMRSKLIG